MIFIVSSLKVQSINAIIGLPPGLTVEYFGRLPMVDPVPRGGSGPRFLIVRPELNWDYDDFALFVEHPQTGFAQIKLKYVSRARDGGTTTIGSEIGEFFFPQTAFPGGSVDGRADPTFNGQKLLLYKPEEFCVKS